MFEKNKMEVNPRGVLWDKTHEGQVVTLLSGSSTHLCPYLLTLNIPECYLT